MIWGQVCAYIEDGNAVIAWAAPNEAGSSSNCGKNRRVPVDLDGFRLVSFGPEAALPLDAWPLPQPPPSLVGQGKADRTLFPVGKFFDNRICNQ